ncbi:MAG: winged helix-turn-helix domain-containing protein [Phycisphaeraceae bacterium]|nr:winged helix-turn-helix domain-containing protein [Phycisphaeraceae bacterium]
MGTKKSGTEKNKKAGAATKAASAAGTEKTRKAAIAEIKQRLEGKPGAASNANKKAGKAPKAMKTVKPKHASALDAAAQVIAGTSKPMRTTEMIEQMEAKGLWKSPGGKTPEATLYAAIIREIAAKGADARFKKHDKGLFVAGKRR